MQGPGEWSIEYYVADDGRSPVGEFLRTVDNRTFRRFQWSIEQLRLRNVRAGLPLVRHLEGKVWELREESRGNIYRLLYFLAPGRRIVLLHGFQKKTQKTPRRELAIALQRAQRYEEREREGSV